MAETAVLGLDVSKAKFTAHFLENEGTKSRSRNFLNSQAGFEELNQWLGKKNFTVLHACMEASGRYGLELAQNFINHGHTISVVNPVRIRRYAESRLERNKTDSRDAYTIALFCLNEKPLPWKPKSEAVYYLQGLIRRSENLKVLKIQESNRLKGNPVSDIKPLIEKMILFIETQIVEVEDLIQKHIDHHLSLKDEVELLISIPGINVTTARKLLSEIDFASFENAKSVAAFIGLTPSIQQSGSSFKRARISKVGSRSTRHALYMPALSAMKCNPITKQFASRLLEQGKAKMAVVCAVMRKLLHIAYGVLKSRKPFDPNYLVFESIA